jgi:bifunctional DNase/RNase
MKETKTMIEMKVENRVLDPKSNMPIVVLKNRTSGKSLPIGIGIFEASAIALELDGVNSPRPLTHDLLKSIIEKLNAKVSKVYINGLKDNTFYAKILLEVAQRKLNIDCRPSDAIALALRTNSPIFVEEKIIADAIGKEDLRFFLESLKRESFGRYKM